MRAALSSRGILGLPDDGRDALMSAALDPPDRAWASWRRWEQSGAHTRTDPVARRWLPLIGHNLRDVPMDAATRTLFVEARRETWASNLRLLEAARPALEALAAAGIRTMLLKGAVLARSPYNEPGLRPMGDVDVLIERTHARRAARLLEHLGWVPPRGYSERDLLLGHALDLRRTPDGAVDLHWSLLTECCWEGADDGLWRRARSVSPATPMTVVPAPSDLLLHVCVHGLRWSPVHAGHWIADAARVIQTDRAGLDWAVLLAEADRRRLGLQMARALDIVRERAHVDIPQTAIDALERQSASWRDRLELRFKARPVVSTEGLFVIWAVWRRSVDASRRNGRRPPPWWPFLRAAIGVASQAALLKRFCEHGWSRALAVLRRVRLRGGSSRMRLDPQA